MSDADLREIDGTGSSMCPFIPPNSRLAVKRVPASLVQKGHVVCYIGAQGRVTAHRVVSISNDEKGRRIFRTRGDAQDTDDVISEEALCYVVRRVAFGPISYKTDGCIGRLISRIALAESRPAAVAKALFSAGFRQSPTTLTHIK